MGDSGFLAAFLSACVTSGKDATAFSVYDGEQITNIAYSQFAGDIMRAAGFFKEKQIFGQHIGLLSPNSYRWLVVAYGIIASGNVAVPLNPALPADLIRQQCAQADVTLLWRDEPTDDKPVSPMEKERFLTRDALMQATPIGLEDIHQAGPEETVILLATSGTTGKSKIAECSLGNIQSYLADVEEIIRFSDRMLLAVPLYHIMGLVSVMSRLQLFQTVCIGRGIKYVILDMPVLNPAFVLMVPSQLESIVKLLKKAGTPERRQKYTGTGLRAIAVGGAGVKLDLCSFMMQLGIQVQSAYGMTETTGAGTWCVWDETNMGSIGKPYGRTQCRIENDELLIRGPSVIKGYYKDPEETSRVIVDGWLHTGDLSYCNEDGYYFFAGRKKNVIILSNGENVNPEEIEAALGNCEAIEECLVYGDEKGICADVFANDRETAAAYIKAYNETMPLTRQVYKVIYTAEPLPKTGSGKIGRKENM